MQQTVKISIFVIFTLLIQSVAIAQYPYQKLIERNNYNKAIQKAKRELKKNPNSSKAYYNLAVLHYLYSFNNFVSLDDVEISKNIDISVYYAKKSESLIPRSNGIHVSKDSLSKLKRNLCDLALQIACRKNTRKAYITYLHKFKACSLNIEKAKYNIIELEFLKCKSLNNIQSYQKFIIEYPYSSQAVKAGLIKDSLIELRDFQKRQRFNISQPLIVDDIDKTVINKYMHFASFIRPNWVLRKEFLNNQGRIIEKIINEEEEFEKRYAYSLMIPLDVTYEELPIIIRVLDSALTKGNNTSKTEYFSLFEDIQNIYHYVCDLEKNGDSLKSIKRQIEHLNSKYWSDLSSNKTSTWFQQNMSISKFQIDVKNKDTVEIFLQKLLQTRLEMGFFKAVMCHGISVSGDIDEIKKSLRMEALEKQLNAQREEGDVNKVVIIEKQLVDSLAFVLHQFYKTNKSIDDLFSSIQNYQQSPRFFITGKENPNCIGYNMIIKKYLDKWGIRMQSVITDGHIFSNVIFSNGKESILDVINNGYLMEVKKASNNSNYHFMIIGKDSVDCLYTNDVQGLVSAYLSNMYKLFDSTTKSGRKGQLAVLYNNAYILPYSNQIWYNIAYIENERNQFEKAYIAISIAANNYSYDAITWSLMSSIALNMNDIEKYEYAKEQYEKLSR